MSTEQTSENVFPAEHMQGSWSDDPLYPTARLLVCAQSAPFRVDLLQSRFLIGYNRASRLMDKLREAGAIEAHPHEQGGYFRRTEA